MNSPATPEQKHGLSSKKLKALEQLLKSTGLELPEEQFPIRKLGRKRAPLSYAQQRLWFINQFEPGSAAYHMPTAVVLQGPLHVEYLEKSLAELVKHHEVLRTIFQVGPDGEVEQVVMPEEKIEFKVMEISGADAEERMQSARALALREFEEPFDLSVQPPFRTCVFRLGPQEQVLLFVIHHIASDAWSQDILLSEVKRLYAGYARGGEPRVEPPPVQYTDYAIWQRERLGRGVMSRQMEYWRAQLSGMKGILELPADRARMPNPSSRGIRYQVCFEDSVNCEVRKLASRENVSLFILLLTAVKVLMWRYTGEKDVALGIPIANRNRPEIERLIGIFVNTIVMRTVLSEQESFRALLRRVKETVLGGIANQDLPFEKLVEELRPVRDPRYTPLFQVMFDVQNSHLEDQSLEGLGGAMHYIDRNESKFDLTLFLNFDETTLRCTTEFRSALFDLPRMMRLCGHLEELLRGVVTNLDSPVRYLPLLPASERDQIVFEWNRTQVEYQAKNIIELFEEQVGRDPFAVAVRHESATLNYQQLNERANQVAHYLRRAGVGPEIMVGICMERSVELVVGLMGILKAGGAYVPLDPAYPAARLEYIASHSAVPLILAHERTFKALPGLSCTLVVCWENEWEQIARENTENFAAGVAEENSAYMVYTSGSTGTPKGVTITHEGLMNYLQWSRECYDTRTLASTPVHSSIGFDLTVTSLYGALLAGGTAIMIEQGAGVEKLRESLESSAGKCLVKLTPSHLDALEGEVENDGVVVIGGEALRYEQLARLRSRMGRGVRIINEYGPTETVVGCCIYEVKVKDEESGPVPIGRPIANTGIYILDKELELAPVGVAGEIYIGGKGLARGYWREGGLTAERFVPHPWSSRIGDRLYRSGDLAQYREDGAIEYIGRIDQQVKIRGHRIELGEVESVLSALNGVREAAVILRSEENGARLLAGYVVLDDVAARRPQVELELKEALRKKLPEYMIPDAVVKLERMPLTENGKVDRNSLPRPIPSIQQENTLPRNELDLRIKTIWEEVLQVPFVGRTSSFFDLGGHSLLATTLMRRLEREFNRQLPLAVLFENPTVEHLSDVIRRNEKNIPQSCLLPLQPRGSKKPLFCVHPVGGNGLCFMQLSRLLGPDQPFFAFQVIDDRDDMEDEHDEFSSIEGRAARYIQALQKVQPQGPYWLGGWSFGGYVAYEMARQLVQQNQEIKILLLLDITTRIGRDPETGDDIAIALRLANELRDLAQLPHISLPEDGPAGTEERLQYVLDELIRTNLVDRQTDMLRLHNYLRGFRRRRQSLQVYHPGPYPGKITLIRTGDIIGAENVTPTDETRGWAELSPQPVRVHTVPGRHHNMVFMPHVLELAETIRGCLQNDER